MARRVPVAVREALVARAVTEAADLHRGRGEVVGHLVPRVRLAVPVPRVARVALAVLDPRAVAVHAEALGQADPVGRVDQAVAAVDASRRLCSF